MKRSTFEHVRSMLLAMFTGTVFIIVIAILLVGTGETKNIKSPFNMSKFSINSDDVIINKNSKSVEKVKIYRTSTGKIEEMYLENYIRGVVSAEMPAEFDIEALKAQAIAARTYAVAHLEKFGGNKCSKAHGGDLCDTVHCQVYIDEDTRLKSWGKESSKKYWAKVTEAVKSTAGEILSYNGKIVESPLYFATSSGKTEDSKDVFSMNKPYLKSVSSLGEEMARKYKSEKSFSYYTFVNSIDKKYLKAKVTLANVKNQVKVIDRSSAGGVKKIKLGNIYITGSQFRFLFGLNSANFSIQYNAKNINIECKGYGHDVGMSQWGANVMAKKGYKYKDILKHYYTGVQIEDLHTLCK